jgi:hypothetical protein
MANASRFTETYFQQPLTDYALGWGAANPKMDALLEFVAPQVITPHRFEYAYGVNDEYYRSETDDVRSIGADFKRVEYTSLKTTSRTFNKGLTVRVDVEEVAGIPDWETRTVDKLMKRLKLNDFRRAITLLKTGTNDAQTWNGTSGENPDTGAASVLERLVVGNTSLGFPALNRVLYGVTAWHKRLLSLSAQSHAAGFGGYALTEQQLAGLLGVDEVMVSREVYASGGAALTTLAPVVDTTVSTTGIVLLFNAQAGQSKDDPSSIKRFVSMTDGGGEYKVYRQEVNAKLVDITVEHYSNVVATCITGCQMITVS